MPELTRITLLTPHCHAGRDYPAGAVLALPTASAEWLISLKRAEPAPGAAVTKPAAVADTAPPCLGCEPAPTKQQKRKE